MPIASPKNVAMALPKVPTSMAGLSREDHFLLSASAEAVAALPIFALLLVEITQQFVNKAIY